MIKDDLIHYFDSALRTVFAKQVAKRPSPADTTPATTLTETERNDCIGKMRVNHVGEVCAQALYQGQRITAKTADVEIAMQQAAEEETDHLAWCEQRLQELGGRTSYLNPIWYGGSFVLGTIAGALGDKWSLGFVAETERQVVAHLQSHLASLPQHDERTRAIISQMIVDENHHAHTAQISGGVDLPQSVSFLMSCTAKIMTTTAYFI